ncbi:POK19 protein, partial [Cephalopterus ornatus]|nr:POK19 protein [Cephalopterus ornatus]
VKHVTGIPHSSTGQAIVERANRTLKEYLMKQKDGETIDPTIRLSKILFTLNYFSIASESEQPPVVIHTNRARIQNNPEISVFYKNPQTGQWEGP